jgi:DNA-binding transcriptional regulator GbsR (MarR family)
MAKSSAMSKTKAKAATRKRKIFVPANNANATPEQTLLAKMMEQHTMENNSVSYADIMKDLGMNDRNTKWRNAWKDLESKDYITKAIGSSSPIFTSGFQLTPTGIDEVATDEYKEALSQRSPQTNEELHERIKSKLMNKRGDDIFDLLLEHGSLSRSELSEKLGISDRGANFSYALQQLKDLDYIQLDPTVEQGRKNKKLCLSDKAFLTRPLPKKSAVSTTVAASKKAESDPAPDAVPSDPSKVKNNVKTETSTSSTIKKEDSIETPDMFFSEHDSSAGTKAEVLPAFTKKEDSAPVSEETPSVHVKNADV